MQIPISIHKAVRLLSLVIFLLFASLPFAWAQGTGYWHTAGNQILDSNNQAVRMAGVNWYGFETTDEIAHGLWAQDYHTVLSEIKSNGYNIIRVPFSNQMVETPAVPTNYSTNNGQAINTDLVGLNALQVLDKIVTAAGADGLRVILDNHRSEAGNSNEANGLWYTSSYPESAWINDWKTLATRYQSFTDGSGNPIVVGMDLRNEPHLMANGGSTGACWTGDTSTSGCPATNTAQNWPAAATRAGNAIQAINPSLLIFVEGNDCYSGDCGWQGGNLEGVASNPVTLSVANHIVYSAHDYGPNLFAQSWFNSSTTFASLEAIWNKFWGYISSGNTAPVWIGEFGTDNNNSDIENTAAGSQGQWFQSIVTFFQDNPKLSWTYWALNGEDSYALLNNSYNGIANTTKQNLLATIQFPLGGGGGTADFSLSASPASLTVNQGSSGTSTITITRLNGFAGAVSFAASGLPSGVTGSFNPTTTTTTGTSSVLTLTASSTATLGSATVTVTGTSGSLTHTTTISLTVSSTGTANFSLSASPTSLTVNQGSSGTSTITVTRLNGFAGAVSFTASGLPSGVTASFNPATTTATGTSSVLTLTASSTATAGTATVTVTGTSGTLTHTVAIALTVAATSGTGGVTLTPVVAQNTPYFNEEDIRLANTASLTALKVTIVVQRTTGVSFSGQYNTIGGQITQANSSTSSTITFTFTLNSGQTLSPGTNYLFAAQTSGSGTLHSVTGDTYTVTYTTGGQTFTQTGNF
jgi:endoglucanase